VASGRSTSSGTESSSTKRLSRSALRGARLRSGNYYVTARFVPDDPFLGVFAVETSAYSRMTEWPGGGLVGIHGTSAPQLLGQAVSHGCVRIANATAVLLRTYAPLGTPISIVAN